MGWQENKLIVKDFNEWDTICLPSTFDYPLIQARTQTLKKLGAIFGILLTNGGESLKKILIWGKR